MATTVTLRSREQILGDLVRYILSNTDLTDVAAGSRLATLLEAIAASDYKISTSALKILENSDLESLTGTALDKKAQSIRLPNGIGGFGRIPASQASGSVTIGSAFQKISSKLYAGKPTPFGGSTTLYLEDASKFPSSGSIYIGRGTVNRFEGAIAYSSVTNSGSFWTMTLSSPLTKGHLQSDLVVLAQGGDRTIGVGNIVQVPGSAQTPPTSYSVNATITIPDGESTGTALVTCTQFGEIGNALAGGIKSFSNAPFAGATVTNPTAFSNGASAEGDEALRKRIKNYPSTLSRGTQGAIVAALTGLSDPTTGTTITSVVVIQPTAPGESSKIYIDNGTGLEPVFLEQPYELLLASASGQETEFSTAQRPITPAIAIGSEIGPFALVANQSITFTVDGVSETYTVSAANYANLNSATAFEVVRDFNAQSNIIGFRTINGGTGLVALDLSGQSEILQVQPGALQEIFGFPTATIRPIFLYENNELKSFRGHTATLSTNPYPWGMTSADLSNVQVIVDGVTQTISITDADFSTFSTNIASATLSQWAAVLRTKVAGVQFVVSGNILVWSTWQAFSPNGSVQIPTTRADGSPAGWVADAKMWLPATSGGKLADEGATKDYDFNRFTGEITLLTKPSPGSKIEIGSRTTRAQVVSTQASTGLFTLTPLSLTVGNSRMVVGFDGTFALRASSVAIGATFTPTVPDPSGASNVIRLFSNSVPLFNNAEVGDYLYLVQDQSTVPTWGSAVEGIYLLKAVGINGFATNQTYSGLTANTLMGSAVVTVTQANHGFKSGAQVSVTTSTAIGGISAGNLSQSLATITVLNSSTWTYVAGATAGSTATGTLDTVVYNADTWVEFEVSTPQLAAWTPLLTFAQSVSVNMVNLFKSTVIPQLVDFGAVGVVTVDQVVAAINGAVAGGTAVKNDPQTFTLRSNDFAAGTVAVLAVIGNASNMIAPTVSTSIQSHIAFSDSGYTQSGFPVVTQVLSPGVPTTGKAVRNYLLVDRIFTDVVDTADNPTIQSPSGITTYPLGFEHAWITGRLMGLNGRVYNNQTTPQFAGPMRGDGAIRPLETADTAQTSPQTFDRYANYGLRFGDLTLTAKDKLVVVMDLNPTDETVAVPMAKRALIQDINAITGSGAGQVIAFRLEDPDDIAATQDLLPSGPATPRYFFDSQSAYRTFDFRDFKLLAHSVGLYHDYSSYSRGATGSLTAIGSGSSGIVNGDTFTLSDGVHTPTIFEFNTGSPAGGHVLVPYVAGAVATGTLTAIAVGTTSGTVANGDTFTLDDGVHTATVFEFNSGSPSAGHILVSIVVAVAATGTVTATNADPVTGIKNGDTFTLNDGTNTPTVFEFNTGSPSGGHVLVSMPSSTATATQIKTAILNAIATVSGISLNITAAAGAGNVINLTNTVAGTVGNHAITESFANGVSLFPTGMSGGLDNYTASQVKTAMISAISGQSSNLNIAPSSGGGQLINLTETVNGAQGNVAITESLAHGTLTPTGMSGGINDYSPTQMQSAMITAINGVGANLTIAATAGAGSLVQLIDTVAGPQGNVAITQSLAHGTLTPVGMSGGSTAVTSDRALVYRSVDYGAPNRLRLSLQYSTTPNLTSFAITHINSFAFGTARLTVYVTLPSGSLIAGSTFSSGSYTTTIQPYGTLYQITFAGAGLNPGGQYAAGNVLNVGGTGPLAASYHITAASAGSVTVIAPGNGGVASGTIFSAVQNPLTSFPLSNQTWTALAAALTAYFPTYPVVTGAAIGSNLSSNYIKEATYESYPNSSAYAGTDMPGAFDWHSFNVNESGQAGIFAYDSSNATLNGIQATVQTADPIFPTTTDASGTTYSPIGEEVVLVPADSRSLTNWLRFAAASSLSIIANIDEIQSCNSIQISSQQDGALGAVNVTGVTANSIQSFVSGNATTEDVAVKLLLNSTDAQALVRGSMVRLDNSGTTELLRPYRAVPTGAAVTTYNTTDVNSFFRPTNAIKYIQLTANTARLVFYRFGTGPSQTEPLAGGQMVTLTNLGSGLVQFASSGGDLAARVGDMMYIKPGSAFASDAQCQGLPSPAGITDGTLPQYLGYPVVNVIDAKTVAVLAPNITTFNTVTLGSATDLVFVPAVYNEKNIRTNKAEGAPFTTAVNGDNFYYLVKKLGGNMVSLWAQNSAHETTDTMRLDDLLVNTDDWVTLGNGFDVANQGTFRLVAHNGRNHMIFYNPNGGKDELLDTTTLSGGGVGQRKWRVGPIADASSRPVRVVDGESVRLNDRLRISTPVTSSQWFPGAMIGSFQIIGLGWVGLSQATGTLTAVAANPSTGIANGDIFTISDGSISVTFQFTTTGIVASGRTKIVIGATDGASLVQTEIINAINGLGASFGITASAGAGFTINLLNRRLDPNSDVAITQTLANTTLSPTGMSGAAADNGQIQAYVDIALTGAPPALFDSTTGLPVDKFLISGNNSAVGFIEASPYYGFRMVGGFGVNPQDPSQSQVYLLPQNANQKFSSTFGTAVTSLFKLNFPERTFQGIDGYKVFGGLVQQAHAVLDGLASNPILFPGVKAMGTVGEVLPPLIRSVSLALKVSPNEGVTINSISDIIRSTVAQYINSLGVGAPVILSEIITIVQQLPGVFSVEIVSTLPVSDTDRIVVGSIEKPFVLNAARDITVG